MKTRCTAALAGLALLLAAWAALAQPRRGDAPPAAAAPVRRCVGVSTSVIRAENPVVTRIYRAFEDGTVETYDDGAPEPRWRSIR
jgi:hypothetical protein